MSENNRKILLLSAYEAKSHKYWRKFLEENFSGYYFTSAVLPPRFFSWRVHGNPIIFSEYESEKLSGNYDLIIATSMCDIATIKGLFPNLSDTPVVVYFHENQFAYPEAERVKSYQDAQIKSINSAVVADRLLFNSFYNMQTFLEKGDRLIRRMPDYNKIKLFDRLADKSEVLPVPVYPVNSDEKISNSVPVILWNHRWEYDKAPERFFKAMENLKKEGYRFKLNIVGQQFRRQPECFNKYKNIFKDEILNWGYVQDVDKYDEILRSSDFVVSTSLHEFQGLAVLEAVSAGVVPVVPDRMSYREIFQDIYKYASYERDSEKDVNALVEKLGMFIDQYNKGEYVPIPDISRFYVSNLKSRYEKILATSLYF
jgi:glycosyltransferase involved in cell wall biosynthesis